eukprot:TRINITY_DN7457_c0_g1_i1.p1 TRINITY_DN7457_c0_g1~~TRINITY_DN7457_c0_g1_i1.p1  ORF type:complete len:856 (+),score=257.83 TRINITY_DN7457_c0_g1_i1:379-2946(+)
MSLPTTEQVSQLLKNALSPDANARNQSERDITGFLQQNYTGFALVMSQYLANEQAPETERQIAGVLVKNSCLYSKDDDVQAARNQQWLAMEAAQRDVVKKNVLAVMASPVPTCRSEGAMVLSKIALIELPVLQWPELMEGLLSNVTTAGTAPQLVQSTLDGIGYICESIDPEILEKKSNTIMTAVIHGMNKANPLEIIVSATRALLHALDFARSNMANKRERDWIMQILGQTSQSPHLDVRVAAFECLVKVAGLYYNTLPQYIEGVFHVTMNTIKTDEEPVALQAIEFWATICDVEYDLLDLEDPETPCHNFIGGALEHLVAVCTECLTKQEEDPDPDDWNLAMGAGSCLRLMASVVPDQIVKAVVPFVEKYIADPNWRFREAATLAFGSILGGPSEVDIEPLVEKALHILLQHMRDESMEVKDTAAWTVCRVCELFPRLVTEDPNKLKQLLACIVQSLEDEPRVASHCCLAILHISEAFEGASEMATSSLSCYFAHLAEKLIASAEREDATENNLRNAANNAIASLIKSSAEDCLPAVNKLTPMFVDKLQSVLGHLERNSSLFENPAALDSIRQHCGTLEVCAMRLKAQIAQFSDRMMEMYLKILNEQRLSGVHDEALNAAGSIAHALEAAFARYKDPMAQVLLTCLQNTEDYSVCSAATVCVGDLAHSLHADFQPYANLIVGVLLTNLKNGNLDRDVKPRIMLTLSDIALEIGAGFAPFLNDVFFLLDDACKVDLPRDDYDHIDYLNTLRESILTAYSGMLIGLEKSNKQAQFLPCVQNLVPWIVRFVIDPITTDQVKFVAIGLIGDIARSLKAEAAHLYKTKEVVQFLHETIQGKDASLKELANYSYQQVVA